MWHPGSEALPASSAALRQCNPAVMTACTLTPHHPLWAHMTRSNLAALGSSLNQGAYLALTMEMSLMERSRAVMAASSEYV